MTTLTVPEVTTAKNADVIVNTSTYGNAGGAIAVAQTLFGHVFVGAASGPGAQAAASKSVVDNYKAAKTYVTNRWASIANVPAGLTLDLTADMTQADSDKAPVPNVTAADMALLGGVGTSASIAGGAAGSYTTTYGTTSAAIPDATGTNTYHATAAAEDQARNLAMGYEAYARRIYRVAAFAKLNPSVGLPT